MSTADKLNGPLADTNQWPLVELSKAIKQTKPGFACGERDDNGIIQLRMNNVTTQGGFDWTRLVRVPAGEALVKEYHLQKGDVVFNNTNSTALVGKSALFGGFAEPVVYSNHFTRFRVREEFLNPAYLAVWLNHQWESGIFAEICNQWIGQSAVKTDRVLALKIPLPPLDQQKRIVERLMNQMTAIVRAREAARSLLATLEAFPAALLRDAFASAD